MPAKSTKIERDIIERIKSAKIRLRFDKVVLWLTAELQSKLANDIPDRETVMFTVTAPIKLPAKTAAALESLARENRPRRNLRRLVHGNHIRIRRLTAVPPQTPKVLVFVHNLAPDATRIVTLAASRLRLRPSPRSTSNSPAEKRRR